MNLQSENDQLVLEEARKQLIGALRTEWKDSDGQDKFPRLIQKIEEFDAQKFGEFLGSVAGHDYNAAFNSLGEMGANYFLSDFKDYLKKHIQGDDPIIEFLNYIPANGSQARDIMRKLMNGEYEGAYGSFKQMIRTEGTAVGQNISEKAVEEMINWVFGSLEVSPGSYFIKIVKFEMWALDVFSRGVEQYLDQHHIDTYIQLRRTLSPSESFNRLEGVTRGALTLTRLEQHYRNSYEGQQAYDKKMSELWRRQEQILARTRDLMQQQIDDMMRAFSKVNNQLLKDIVEAYTEAKADHTIILRLNSDLGTLHIRLKTAQKVKDRTGLDEIALDPATVGEAEKAWTNLQNFFKADAVQPEHLEADTKKAAESIALLMENKQRLAAMLLDIRTQGNVLIAETEAVLQLAESDKDAVVEKARRIRDDITELMSKYEGTWQNTIEVSRRLVEEIRILQQQSDAVVRMLTLLEQQGQDLSALTRELGQYSENNADWGLALDRTWSSFQAVCGQLRALLSLSDKNDLEIYKDGEFYYQDARTSFSMNNTLLASLNETVGGLKAQHTNREQLRQRYLSWRLSVSAGDRINPDREEKALTRLDEKYSEYIDKLRLLLERLLTGTGLQDEKPSGEQIGEAARLLEEAVDIAAAMSEETNGSLVPAVEQLRATHLRLGKQLAALAPLETGLDQLLARGQEYSRSVSQVTFDMQNDIDLAGNNIDEMERYRGGIASIRNLLESNLARIESIETAADCQALVDLAGEMLNDAKSRQQHIGPLAAEISAVQSTWKEKAGFDETARLHKDIRVFLDAVTSPAGHSSETVSLETAADLTGEYTAGDFISAGNTIASAAADIIEAAPGGLALLRKMNIILEPLGDTPETVQLKTRAAKTREIIERYTREADEAVKEARTLVSESEARLQRLEALVNTLTSARISLRQVMEADANMRNISLLFARAEEAATIVTGANLDVQTMASHIIYIRSFCDRAFTGDGEGGDLQDAIDELKNEQGQFDGCSQEQMIAIIERFKQQYYQYSTGISKFKAYVTSFNKQVDDQISDLSSDGFAAYCYSAAVRIAGEMRTVYDALQMTRAELLAMEQLCPQFSHLPGEFGITMADILAADKSPEQFLADLADMLSRLKENGCDEEEIILLGDSQLPSDMDPEAFSQGGSMSEVAGDGIDNDGNSLLDENVVALSGYNITIIVTDNGPEQDDVFGLYVSRNGYRGATPEGGTKSYGLNLLPGDYTATVTTFKSKSGAGTFAMIILQDGDYLTGLAGYINEGSSATLRFRVKGKNEE
ncbi:hypothetical protein JXO52_09275 [bacterium]|nr:hypothetical protein [bacterium]